MPDQEVASTPKEIESPEDAMLDGFLNGVPEEHREQMKQMIVSSFQMHAESSPSLEVMKKMTPEHITGFLEASKEEMEKSYRDRNFHRLFLAVMTIVAMAFVITIIVLLKNTPDVMEKVIYAGGGLVAGLIGGYGIGKTRNNE